MTTKRTEKDVKQLTRRAERAFEASGPRRPASQTTCCTSSTYELIDLHGAPDGRGCHPQPKAEAAVMSTWIQRRPRRRVPRHAARRRAPTVQGSITAYEQGCAYWDAWNGNASLRHRRASSRRHADVASRTALYDHIENVCGVKLRRLRMIEDAKRTSALRARENFNPEIERAINDYGETISISHEALQANIEEGSPARATRAGRGGAHLKTSDDRDTGRRASPARSRVAGGAGRRHGLLLELRGTVQERPGQPPERPVPE
jgi:hypothetical protein